MSWGVHDDAAAASVYTNENGCMVDATKLVDHGRKLICPYGMQDLVGRELHAHCRGRVAPTVE